MSEEKRLEIKAILWFDWDNHPDKFDLANEVMEGFIWGPYGTNEHYLASDIYDICLEIEAEKNPPVVEG